MNSIAKMSSSSYSSSSSINGEKYNMKQFILAVQDYNKSKNEETASLLSRYLQLLGVTSDLNTFDPHNSVVTEFFVNLHELMGNLESKSNLIWCGVSVLQYACKNPATHKALIHTYQFLPVLGRLLGDHLTREKKIKLLTLMQELSYGIKITYQISHLPQLIVILAKWVESGDEAIVALSLGVLLNLCYKNDIVIYTLMRTINTKHFIRTVISTKTPATEIQICKLLIILEHTNGEVPEDIILNFLILTFRTIAEAFRIQDLVRMRHIVEFFSDVTSHSNRSNAIMTYNYRPEVEQILDEVENAMETESEESNDIINHHECVSLLLEFLNSLLELELSDLIPLHPKIVNLALNWVQNESVCSKALDLLKSVTFIYSNNLSSDLVESLASKFPLFLHLFQNNMVQTVTTTEHCNRMCALLQLLRALVCCKEVRSKIIEELSKEALRNILVTMLGNEEVLKYQESNDGIRLCINILVLLSELSQHDNSWYNLYQELIKRSQIHMILAKALYGESEETKELVFEISSINKFPKREIARVMNDIHPTFEQKLISPSKNNTSFEVLGQPVMTPTQSSKLEQVIQMFREAVGDSQVSNVAVSDVIEMYEYQISAMAHTERATQASLNSASQLVTHLQHRVSQVTAELSRAQQLLYHTCQCYEQAQKQISSANESIKKLTSRLTKEEITNKELDGKIKERENELIEKNAMINTLEIKQQELLQANKTLTKKYESQCEKNRALVTGAEKLENCVNDLNSKIQEKNEALTKSNFRIEQMAKEIKELEELRKQNEATIIRKEKELQDALQDLTERQKILDTITRLTTSKS